MEKTSKRGKIPQHDWPSIISRYESGETLASIARTYDCSPPAISYIVSRTRARGMAGEGTGPKADLLAATEPQLVKAGYPAATQDMPDSEFMHSNNPAKNSNPSTETVQLSATEKSTPIPDAGNREWSADAPPAPDFEKPAPAPDFEKPAFEKPAFEKPAFEKPAFEKPAFEKIEPVAENDRSAPHAGGGPQPRDDHETQAGIAAGNVSLRPPGSNGGSPPSAEARRTLHLSLPHGNGAAAGSAPHPAPVPQNGNNFDLASDVRAVPRPATPTGFAPQPRQPSAQDPHFAPLREPGGMHAPAAMPDPSVKARASGTFIDHALRERINDDIAVFLAAFDAALDHDTAESRTELREATDRLLRAGARTRIELERLEARVPLAARESGQRPFPVPRAR